MGRIVTETPHTVTLQEHNKQKTTTYSKRKIAQAKEQEDIRQENSHFTVKTRKPKK